MLPFIVVSDGTPMTMDQAKKLVDQKGLDREQVIATLAKAGIEAKQEDEGRTIVFKYDGETVKLSFNERGVLRGLNLGE